MNDDQNIKIICPDCGGDQLQKFGKTKAGRQKYRCLNSGCRRQFVHGSAFSVPTDIKTKVMALLDQNVNPQKIYAAFSEDISLRWIYQLRRRMTKKHG